MTDLRQAAMQALEALIYCEALNRDVEQQKTQAITALRTALEQPEQEPKVRTGDCLLCGVCASEGHKIQAQRPWVGLTDEDVNKESTMIASQMKLAFHAGMYVAQQILKERNT